MPRSAPTSSSVWGASPSSPKRRAEHVPHPRLERRSSASESSAERRTLGRRVVGPVGVRVLDQVAVEALAVADGRLEADRILDELEQRAYTLDSGSRSPWRSPAAVGSRFSFWARTRRARMTSPHLLGDVDRQADRPALVGERPRDRLADPPGRIGRELVAELVVELLDRPDQAEVPLLDQVEQRDAGLRVVARDRHHEPEVRLDQLSLCGLVALVLAARELALLLRREQAPVADLADVELEGIGGLRLASPRPRSPRPPARQGSPRPRERLRDGPPPLGLRIRGARQGAAAAPCSIYRYRQSLA